jgi:hypothetical protein
VNRISSHYTRFLKWAFPAFWFGALGLFMLRELPSRDFGQDPVVFIGPVAMAVLGWFFFKGFVWDVVDEVLDAGEALVVRWRGAEETIRFDDIQDVRMTRLTSPQRISLHLARPGRFGAEIAFFPNANRLGPGLSGGATIAQMLAAKVARARSNRA